MRTHRDVAELAVMCARNARLASTREVAVELWRMALEYQLEFVKLNAERSRTSALCRCG